VKVQVDFLDLGAGHGGSYKIAKHKFGGKVGLCIDKNPERVKLLKDAGYVAACLPIQQLDKLQGTVRFSMACHVLEHLPSYEDVYTALKTACKKSREFVYVEGPSFDFDDYLEQKGTKFYWRDGCGHKTRVTTSFLQACAASLKLPYSLLIEKPLLNSTDSQDIIPLDAASNSYCEALNSMCDLYIKEGAKPRKPLCPPIYRSFVYVLWVGKPCKQVLKARPKFYPYAGYGA